EVLQDLGELGRRRAARVALLTAVHDDEEEVVLVDDPDRRARLLALDRVVPDVRVDLDVVDPGHDLAVLDERGPERQRAPHPGVDEALRVRPRLVVDLDVAVAVEREALARTLVPVHDAVADADAGVTE